MVGPTMPFVWLAEMQGKCINWRGRVIPGPMLPLCCTVAAARHATGACWMWALQGDSAGKTCNLQSNEKRAHPANRARKTVWALIEFHHHEHSWAHSNERSRGRDRHGWHAGGGPHTELVVCVGRRRRARTRRHDYWRGQPAAPAHSHTTHLTTLAAHVRCTLPLRAGCSWGGALAARCPLHPTLHPLHPTRAARRVCGAEILVPLT